MTKKPILIGGCGRSGTTLLLSILSSHPQIYAIPFETNAFCKSDYLDVRLDKENFNIEIIYKELLKQNATDKYSHWCEKTPKNIQRVDELINYFGKGLRFIHIVRDGRDVVTSKHPGKGDTYYVSPERWIDDVSAGIKYLNHEQVITIRYEDLLIDYKSEMKNLCKFIGIEYSAEFETYPESAKIKSSKAWHHKAKSLHKEAIKKWNNPEHKKVVQSLLQNERAIDLLTRLNYI